MNAFSTSIGASGTDAMAFSSWTERNAFFHLMGAICVRQEKYRKNRPNINVEGIVKKTFCVKDKLLLEKIHMETNSLHNTNEDTFLFLTADFFFHIYRKCSMLATSIVCCPHIITHHGSDV
uniref:Uncharacterized protein n=1 Tax=Romanomermis culicivorax TaxID=13658 RepID=A0A915JQ04_ROMCU